MADVMINKIESSAKIEVLIGIGISALIGLLSEKVIKDLPIPMELFIGIGLLMAVYFGIQGMYYLKFIIQKWMWLKEQRTLAEIQGMTVIQECKKLELQIQLSTLEAAMVG